MGWTNPAAQARIDAHAAQQRERYLAGVPVRAEPIPGARAFTLEQVGPGWTIASARRHFATGEDDAAFEAPVAGVVVEVLHDRGADPETGEIWDRTRYRTLTTWRPQDPWNLIGAEEVDLTQLCGLDRQAAANAVRWLVRPIAKGRRSWLTASEISAITDAWRLAAAVA